MKFSDLSMMFEMAMYRIQLTIGELLSRGDDTSMLDSSS